MAKHSIATQIAEVEAEIAMRRKVYPGQVARRAMREGEAELKLAIMGSVRETLLFCQRHEESIREFIAARPVLPVSGPGVKFTAEQEESIRAFIRAEGNDGGAAE